MARIPFFDNLKGGRGSPPSDTTKKIVSLKPGTDIRVFAKEIEEKGGSIIRELPLINACLCAFPQKHSEVASILESHPHIDSVDDDIKVRITSFPPAYWGSGKVNQPPQEIGWGVKRINAEPFLNVRGASTVKVAVMDTGIYARHPDLEGCVRGGVNIIGNSHDLSDPNGHGTHVAGIIGALNNDIGIVGVMPGASIYSVKVFDASGEGSLSDIILGLQWCIANDIKIVNMSFGSSEENNSYRQVIANAEKAGIIMVAAAGNDRVQHKMQYPALYDQTIAVSALSQTGMIASFSSFGEQVDVIAPGENIKSTWKDGSYKEESGTSMATPFVTGAIAQMINKWGEMSPAQVKRHLKECCTMLPMPQIYQGAGLVNLQALLNKRP